MPNSIPMGELPPGRFAIVVAKWNESITRKLHDGAVTTLVELGVAEDSVDVAWVPGSWELPVVAQHFARSREHVAVIALGAVIRGETTHDEHINRAVSLALSQIALETQKPVLLGLLTCQTMEQAIHRAGGNVGNKGSECAEAAVEMARLMASLDAGA